MKKLKEFKAAGRRFHKLIARLERWCGFEYHFNGTVSSPNWSGYKMRKSNGDFVIHLFRKQS